MTADPASQRDASPQPGELHEPKGRQPMTGDPASQRGASPQPGNSTSQRAVSP